MLREMVATLTLLTVTRPVILVFEDLHWSDYATLDLLTALAKRRDPARLLVVATYRPAEALQRQHPLHNVRKELSVHGQCTELALTLLTVAEVADYLAARFSGTHFPTALAPLVHQRTEGNPLFMVTVVEDWVQRGWLAQTDQGWTLRVGLATLASSVPESLRQMLEQQLAQLQLQERRVLTVGSAAGAVFSAAAVAAGLSLEVVQVEEWCTDRALQSYAHMEATHYLQRALVVLETLPNTAERAARELALHAMLAPACMAIHGYAAPEVLQVYHRAYALSQQVEATPQRFDVLQGLCVFYQEKAALQTAYTLATQLVELAQSLQDPIRLLWAYNVLGYTLFYQGELVQARTYMEESLTLYGIHTPHADGFVFDPGVDNICGLAEILHLLGYADQALRRGQEALTLARQIAHPFSIAQALGFAARLHRWRGELLQAQALVTAGRVLCDEYGYTQELAEAMFWHGSDLVQQGQIEAGILQMRQGLQTLQTAGAETRRPWLLSILAGTYGQVGQVEAGLMALDEALDIVQTTGKRLDEAGIHRRKGELLMQLGQQSQTDVSPQQWLTAEMCFQRSLEVARQQQAKSFELRAAMSLARLWQQQGKYTAAHELLAPLYGWFTEGFDTTDLQKAKALLTQLQGVSGHASTPCTLHAGAENVAKNLK